MQRNIFYLKMYLKINLDRFPLKIISNNENQQLRNNYKTLEYEAILFVLIKFNCSATINVSFLFKHLFFSLFTYTPKWTYY